MSQGINNTYSWNQELANKQVATFSNTTKALSTKVEVLTSCSFKDVNDFTKMVEVVALVQATLEAMKPAAVRTYFSKDDNLALEAGKVTTDISLNETTSKLLRAIKNYMQTNANKNTSLSEMKEQVGALQSSLRSIEGIPAYKPLFTAAAELEKAVEKINTRPSQGQTAGIVG